MQHILEEAKVWRRGLFKLLTRGSKYYLETKSVEGFDNDLAYLTSMRLIAESVVLELRRIQDYFDSIF
jgi:hypothetical protein